MFSKSVLLVEVLSLELRQKTEKWAESVREIYQKEGAKKDEDHQHLVEERRKIMDCGMRLIQCIEENFSSREQTSTEPKGIFSKEHLKHPAETEEPSTPTTTSDPIDRRETNSDLLSPPRFPNVFSDSGVDVTEEDKQNNLSRTHETMMNGLTAGHSNCEPLESINTLRETLRHLKQTTDKAVVRFLVRSREVLREEIKSQNDIERDEKLLGLISDLLRNKHEAEKQLKEMSCSYDEGNPLSVLEKSLCYVLVDKALLNCLLLLDKALMEGKLTDRELNSECSIASSGQKLVSEFSQALNDKRQFIELRDELKRKETLVDKMRVQIREILSDKSRLENENKKLEEKSRLWQLKSEDGEMRISVIDSDRKRLKEKVLFLEESMSGLQSSTEHLRHQLQTMEQQDDASRKENELLKEKLHNYSEEMKRVEHGNRSREKSDKQSSSSVKSPPDDPSANLNSNNLAAKIESLLNENRKLRSKVETLETGDYELREQLTALTHAHTEVIQQKNEELRGLREQNKTLGDDLDERLTEILLLKSEVVELQNKGSTEQGHANRQPGVRLDVPDGITENALSLGGNVLPLSGVLADSELQQIRELSHRAKSSEHRVEEYTALLEELSKRKAILVNKLEMIGAVTVIRNDFDVPDGYTEAIDGALRSQSSLIEKGVLSMLSEREQKANERRLLEEENRRLRFTTEALETENLLLQVQVSDLTQTVEELEEDVFYMKSGGKPGKGKRPGTPSGSSGHRVTFEVDSDKKEEEKLEDLVQNAKQRCVNLERQIRSNTSLFKTAQHQNENLHKDHEDLRRENCNLRQYLEECQTTNKILHIKVSELEERLRTVDISKSLDEMEKQSLLDRLKIFEGQIKFLKVEKETMRSRMESLQRESNSSAETQRSQSVYSKFVLLEEANDEMSSQKNALLEEVERLKNKIKKQSARSRILKSEVSEFLDDIRCLENELGSAVDGFCPPEKSVCLTNGGKSGQRVSPSTSQGLAPLEGGNTERGVLHFEADKSNPEVNTWGVATSLCQQNGLAPVMVEIVELLNCTVQRLQRVSGKLALPTADNVDGDSVERRDVAERQQDLRKQLSGDIAQLRSEKRALQREVFMLKAISEHTLDLQPRSPEDIYKANEKDRGRALRKQLLDSVQRNTELEGEILDYLTQKWALEAELDNLKARILNLKDERDILLSLSDSVSSPFLGHNWGKAYDKSMRNFCFVKNHGNEFEVHDVLRIESDLDNEDVFSCPSDECVCHSPDREASSCDSGYNSARYEEGHHVAFNDKGDSAVHSHHVIPHTSTRPLHVSYYENTQGTERHVSESLHMVTGNKKPKGILKKRNVSGEHGSLSSEKSSVDS